MSEGLWEVAEDTVPVAGCWCLTLLIMHACPVLSEQMVSGKVDSVQTDTHLDPSLPSDTPLHHYSHTPWRTHHVRFIDCQMQRRCSNDAHSLKYLHTNSSTPDSKKVKAQLWSSLKMRACWFWWLIYLRFWLLHTWMQQQNNDSSSSQVCRRKWMSKPVTRGSAHTLQFKVSAWLESAHGTSCVPGMKGLSSSGLIFANVWLT